MATNIAGISGKTTARGVITAPAKVSVKSNSVVANASGANSLTLAAAASAKAAATKKKARTQDTTKSRQKGKAISTKKNVLIKWHDVEFYANADEVRGLTKLTISGSVETENKEAGGTKFVAKKSSKGFECTITAFFDMRLGIKSVKDETMKLVNYGANGQTGYLYAKDSKLVTSNMMLTSAKASKIIMSPTGTWISCEVELTLKTCSKLDGGTDKPEGGSGYKYSCTVYYSGSSGAIHSVWAGSNVSKEDARKKAWARVPKTAHWASETRKQATLQDPRTPTEETFDIARKRVAQQQQQSEGAKKQGETTGITPRAQEVQKRLWRVE